jgi:SPX domain protein involved in polyphosphate accumulation
LRYERKYLITDYSFRDVEQITKFHPACFSEIFYERSVNNIYFDSPGMNDYYDNIEGSTKRKKVRIRWYGDLMGTIDSSILEHKIKSGLLGRKASYKLKPFCLDSSFNKEQIKNALNDLSIPNQVKDEVLSLRPVLLNSYKRRYFLSADKNFRVTIDHDLKYYKINYNNPTFLNKYLDPKSVIMELKYDSLNELKAQDISNEFPFMMTKNSKYLSGLERVFI